MAARDPFDWPWTWRAFLGISITYGVGRLLAGAASEVIAGPSSSVDVTGEVPAALLVGGLLAWLTPRLAGPRRATVGVLTLALLASVAAVMVEGSAFAPGHSPASRLPLGLLLQLGVSGATAAVAVLLSPRLSESPSQDEVHALAYTRGVAVAAMVYVVAYFVTGAMNYLLVTGPYYATHAGGLTRPQPEVVLAVALFEGLLLTVGTVPLARALSGPRSSRALVCGLSLWMLGGLVPLLQEASLPDVVRLASAVEILFQKVPLGVAVVGLLTEAPRGRRGATGAGRQGGIGSATGVSGHPESHGSNAAWTCATRPETGG